MKPKVFINSINKKIKNNMSVFHFVKDDIMMIDESVDVRSKIKKIFDSSSFVYKSRVEIILKDGTKVIKDIIAIKDNNLITLDDIKINIDDIIDIKKAS